MVHVSICNMMCNVLSVCNGETHIRLYLQYDLHFFFVIKVSDHRSLFIFERSMRQSPGKKYKRILGVIIFVLLVDVSCVCMAVELHCLDPGLPCVSAINCFFVRVQLAGKIQKIITILSLRFRTRFETRRHLTHPGVFSL